MDETETEIPPGYLSADEVGAAGYYPTPSMEERQNVHTFLHNVAITKDTTKLGFLSEIELGTPKLPLRTFKELQLFCQDIMDQEQFGDYFKKKGEILTSTSLSKDAKLLTSAILQKREVSDISKPRVISKSWFKPKKKSPEEEA